jgi:hypothetical protein
VEEAELVNRPERPRPHAPRLYNSRHSANCTRGTTGSSSLAISPSFLCFFRLPSLCFFCFFPRDLKLLAPLVPYEQFAGRFALILAWKGARKRPMKHKLLQGPKWHN